MDNTVVTQVLNLDLSNFESNMGKAAQEWDQIGETAKKATANNPFKGQADDLNKVNTQLRAGSDLFKKITANPKVLQGEISRLSSELIKYASTQDKATKGGNWKQTADEIAGVKDKLKETNYLLDQTPKAADRVKGGFDRIGQSIKAAFTLTGILFLIDKIIEIGKTIVEVTGIGQHYQNQFTRIFEGNAEAAEGYLAVLQNTADTTNFTFDTLADNIAKLASRGIIPTKKELLGLGDVANFINKDFEQLNEAILDANNSERWKELGFTVKTQGNKMTLAYGDFTKTVDNSVKGAYEAIQAFSALGKVQGSTIEAGQSLSGKISTLTDLVAGFFRTIGQGNTGVLNDFVDLLSKIVQGGIDLVKTLQPAFSGLTKVFGEVFTSVGSLITSLNSLNGEGGNVGTTAQKIGYYFNKYVIDPFVLTINITAQLVESFNTIVIAGQLVAAKLAGNKGLASTLNGQLIESGKRLKEYRNEFGKTLDDMRVSMDKYVSRDNMRQRRQDRRARLSTEAFEGFTPTKTATATPSDAGAKVKAEEQAQKEREDLVKSKTKLEDELQKLQDTYDKQRLDSLDKSSKEYLLLKQQQDLKEIEQTRAHLIKLGQELTGYYAVNRKTGKREKVDNLAYKLPQSTEAIFDSMRAQSSPDLYQNDTDKLTSSIKADFSEKLAKENLSRQQKYADLELQMRKDALAETEKLTRQAGESEQDFEQRRTEALLKIRLDYYRQLLALAEKDPFTDPSTVQGFKETIQQLQGELKSVKEKGKTGPQNIFELLNITFKDSSGKDVSDEVKQQLVEAGNMAINTANQILDAQIANDQARISSIDAQLQAKQNEVAVELELSKQGLANNLALKKQEQAALQAERKKAVEAQRRDQTIQIALNTVLQESEMALALAKTIRTFADYPPPFGLILAGVQIAGMLALLASSISQVHSLPKYHDGDEVTHDTARARTTSGGRKADEVDARLQIGEGVIRKESYQPNKQTLTKINKLGRRIETSDLAYLLDGTGVDLPEGVRERDLLLIHNYNESRSTSPDYELHRRVDGLTNRLDTLIDETRKGNKGSTITQLPDGRIREVDENGNVTVYRRT
ncbi:hypothetical protein [Spirosoma sp.]|uniref:hypothetical protein n=1 Tax=Spirosoma sp. TaxID=1899569 RepID=UPI002601AF22|nr:hypothetical protein [Spirosoma sp.]MCX6218340.1 hypothetical protein [Spirosoma sp.]